MLGPYPFLRKREEKCSSARGISSRKLALHGIIQTNNHSDTINHTVLFDDHYNNCNISPNEQLHNNDNKNCQRIPMTKRQVTGQLVIYNIPPPKHETQQSQDKEVSSKEIESSVPFLDDEDKSSRSKISHINNHIETCAVSYQSQYLPASASQQNDRTKNVSMQISQHQQQQDESIFDLCEHNFLVGRGSFFYRHGGNRCVHDLVVDLLPAYIAAKSSCDRMRIVELVISSVQSKGGRFLERKKAIVLLPQKEAGKRNDGKGNNGRCNEDIGHKEAWVSKIITEKNMIMDVRSYRCEWGILPHAVCRQKISQRFGEELRKRRSAKG